MKKAILILPLFLFSKYFSQFNTASYGSRLNSIKVSQFVENHFNGNFLSYHIEGNSKRKREIKTQETPKEAEENKSSEQEKEVPKEKEKIKSKSSSKMDEPKNNENSIASDLEEDFPLDEIEDLPDKKVRYKRLSLITNSNNEFTEKQIVFMPLKRMLITSNYGNRFHPVDRVNKFHAGIDLRANSDYVYAVLDGIVSEADYSGGAGNYIKVRHKDFETVYMHLTRSFYSEGDLIYAGDIIALSGNTGKSTAPHLHFAVKENGRYINPIQFLNDLIQTNNALADYNNGK
ncbi:M23 family metallopeptidase [Epilithonimonas hominis]|uniref:M23 family metallopeptidase n=1 Tax=Epilithonimonas hominis TaxID=420404 RepID=UPI002897E4A1|nr:M23 family metallopeptidase [Epilithonimonas hominis]